MEVKIFYIEKTAQQAIVFPRGKIDVSNAKEFKYSVMDLIHQDLEKIIIDFSNVTSIDSSGIGKLLLLNKTQEDNGRQFMLRNISSDYIKKVFKMIKIDQVLLIE